MIFFIIILTSASCQKLSPYQEIIRGDIDEPDDFYLGIKAYQERMSNKDFNSLLDSLLIVNKDIMSLNLIIGYLIDNRMCHKIPKVEEACAYFQSLPMDYEWKVEISPNYYRTYSKKSLAKPSSVYNSLIKLKEGCQ